MPSREENLLWYLAWKTGQAGGASVKTRLVKLLYLVELAYAQAGMHPVTDLDWRFHHYGPYAAGIDETLDTLVATKALRPVKPRKDVERDAHLYRAKFPPPELLPSELKRVVDEVCAQWARAELEDLLNHVYFETAPMRFAVRGDTLDLRAAPSDPEPVAGYAPLEPPQMSESLRRKLAEWRRDLRARPAATFKPLPVGAEESALMAVGEMDELVDPNIVMARGTLRLAPEVEVAD